MNWFKIDVKDIIGTGLTDRELGALIRIQAHATLQERTLTDEELLRLTTRKTLEKLKGIISEKIENILIFSEKNKNSNQKNAEKIRNWRLKQKECNQLRNGIRKEQIIYKQHPPTPQKGDACFSENVEKEKTQDTENKNIILERWIDLKIQTGKNIMNVGGYKARLAKALSDGTASLQEMRSDIEKMQNELDNKKRKQQEMELILQSNEAQCDFINDQKISNDAIMIFYHSLPTQEKEKIQNEVEKKAIKENPRFEYFPPTIQKMTRTAHLIDICMPMLMEATKCAN